MPLVSPPMDAIVVEELRKRYGDVQALDGVSFAVREGEVFGLLGPNGAGKSTTVRSLVTLTTPDSGSASVAGYDVLREQNAVRRVIGYVPQDSGVDRLAIVSQGKIVVEGTPSELKAGLRGDAVHVEVESGVIDEARRVLATVGAAPEQVLDGRTIVSRVENGGRALPGIISALETAGIPVASVSLSRPSLDDVYLHFTGREFASED